MIMDPKPMHLLIVDDEEAHIEAIRRAFDVAEVKADIHAASTLWEYRAHIAAQLPDLALIDLNLPDGRAVEILTHPPEDAPFPVLVMTAFGNQQIVVEVMKAGALDYVVKSPESFAVLPRTVERALREWKLLQDHKLAAVALRESESRFHSLVYHMTEGVSLHEMIYDEHGKAVNYRIVDVNPAFEIHTGIKAENVRNRIVTEIYQLDAAPFLNIYERVARTGEPDSFVAYFPPLKKTFSISAYSIKPGWFASAFTDITQRVKTEESHARLVTAVEQAAETIVITDPLATIVYVNPAFEKSTGYSSEEVMGKNPRILKSGKQDAGFYHSMWTDLAAGKVWSGRMINKRKDGTLFEEDASISPVFDATGKIINYVGVKRDVTREVQLEQQCREAQKMEAIGRLAGGVAHDFNNILAVILMNASIMNDDKRITPVQADGLNEIALAAERGAALTRQMLAFSRRQVMQSRELNLNDVVAGITKMLQRLIGEDIVLQTHLSPDDMLVKGDSGMIEQVLLNLVVNSRDAMPEGGRIVVSVDGIAVDGATVAGTKVQAGNFVRLTVRDNGCGIMPEYLPHIFEPFYTTKEAGKGTGLGLATVHGIVEQHHGWVKVESQPGQGTVFYIYLPRLPKAQLVRSVEHTAVAVRGGHETILLVEDEPSLRMLAIRILEQHGYRVLEASDGMVALEIWRQHCNEINLLLTDVIMPGGISGGKLAKQLRAEKPGLKIIYMSGYSGEVAGRGLNLQEGDNFLQKPFVSTILVQAVRECLDRA